jgi:hypothetical protein
MFVAEEAFVVSQIQELSGLDGIIRKRSAAHRRTRKHLTRPDILSRMKTYAVPIGIDILGLGTADQERIRQIGLWAWMDEIADRPRKKKPSRYSLEYRQAQMKRREQMMVRRGRKVRRVG